MIYFTILFLPDVFRRAKLYRYDGNESPPEWKERGTGNVKMLHHKMNDTVRVVCTDFFFVRFCKNFLYRFL